MNTFSMIWSTFCVNIVSIGNILHLLILYMRVQETSEALPLFDDYDSDNNNNADNLIRWRCSSLRNVYWHRIEQLTCSVRSFYENEIKLNVNIGIPDSNAKQPICLFNRIFNQIFQFWYPWIYAHSITNHRWRSWPKIYASPVQPAYTNLFALAKISSEKSAFGLHFHPLKCSVRLSKWTLVFAWNYYDENNRHFGAWPGWFRCA